MGPRTTAPANAPAAAPPTRSPATRSLASAHDGMNESAITAAATNFLMRCLPRSSSMQTGVARFRRLCDVTAARNAMARGTTSEARGHYLRFGIIILQRLIVLERAVGSAPRNMRPNSYVEAMEVAMATPVVIYFAGIGTVVAALGLGFGSALLLTTATPVPKEPPAAFAKREQPVVEQPAPAATAPAPAATAEVITQAPSSEPSSPTTGLAPRITAIPIPQPEAV